MKIYPANYLKDDLNSEIFNDKENLENHRGTDKKASKKFCFKDFKNNACSSLNDVECFLNNFKHYYKYIHLYKFLK